MAKTKRASRHFKVAAKYTGMEQERAAVPPNGPHGSAGHRQARARLLLGRCRVAGAPGAPVSKALLPVLPAGQGHLRRATRRGHGRPGRPLGNAPVSPEKREEKEGKGKEKDLRIFSLLHLYLSKG